MKYKVVYSTKFRKDKKRYQHDIAKMKALMAVTEHLEQTGGVPAKYKPHKLHGIYEGCTECHVLSDLLLIWIDNRTNTVWLERLGTHHELFGL